MVLYFIDCDRLICYYHSFLDSVKAFGFVFLYEAIVLLVTCRVTKSEKREDLIGSGYIDVFKLSFAVAGLREIGSKQISNCLVG
jgi:hypothetical protein